MVIVIMIFYPLINSTSFVLLLITIIMTTTSGAEPELQPSEVDSGRKGGRQPSKPFQGLLSLSPPPPISYHQSL